MSYNKEEVKELLDIEDIYTLLEYYNAEPQIYYNHIEALTICHDGDSHKLYYYENTKLFKCYTGSCGSFDVFELIQKQEHLDDLNAAVYFVVQFFNLEGRIDQVDVSSGEDWKIFERYKKIAGIHTTINDKLILPEKNKAILKYYPQPLIKNWQKEGIEKEVCDLMNIRYDAINGGILIPHTDEDSRLVGIRIRTLVKEFENDGKYRPWKNGKELFNHPLGFNLYGLDKAKENIKRQKVAIIVESEKSVLQFISYLGLSNDICVAVCGSSLSKYQFQLLYNLGINELIIGFDKDFQEKGSNEYYQVQDKWEKTYRKYGNLVNMSFLWDKDNLLGYKSSPLDHGKDIFMHLFRNRVYLN